MLFERSLTALRMIQIKDVCSQGGLSSADKGGSSNASALLEQRTSDL